MTDDLRSYWADVVPDHPVPHAGEPACAICGFTQSQYAKHRTEGGHEKNWPEVGFIEARSAYTSRIILVCPWCNMHLLEHYETALEPRFKKRYEIRFQEMLTKLKSGLADIESLLGEFKSE